MAALDPHSVENCVGRGTPDLNYRDGWIELKWNKHWPVGEDVPVAVSKNHPLSKAQSVWLQRRWRKGGRCFVMLCCGREYLLWAGCDAGKLGSRSKRDLVQCALAYWPRGLVYDQFSLIVTAQMKHLEALRDQAQVGRSLYKP